MPLILSNKNKQKDWQNLQVKEEEYRREPPKLKTEQKIDIYGIGDNIESVLGSNPNRLISVDEVIKDYDNLFIGNPLGRKIMALEDHKRFIEYENRKIIETLTRTKGRFDYKNLTKNQLINLLGAYDLNFTQMSKDLRIPINTLKRLLYEYGLDKKFIYNVTRMLNYSERMNFFERYYENANFDPTKDTFKAEVYLFRYGKYFNLNLFVKTKAERFNLFDILNNKIKKFSIKEFRRKLILAGLMKEECYICGFKQFLPGQNEPPLFLDHIDKNRENNSLSNLRLLCPNHFLIYGDTQPWGSFFRYVHDNLDLRINFENLEIEDKTTNSEKTDLDYYQKYYEHYNPDYIFDVLNKLLPRVRELKISENYKNYM